MDLENTIHDEDGKKRQLEAKESNNRIKKHYDKPEITMIVPLETRTGNNNPSS